MNNLIINKTKFTPGVDFNLENNRFIIEGDSVPESAQEFYKPVLNWLNEFESRLYYYKNENINTKKFELNFKFDYFNSTSAKFILDIFLMINKFAKAGYDVQINWHYKTIDEDMKDAGEEFEGLCPGLPIIYFSV